jgi:tRNA U34 5-methylaminomethyl-2-thiouridine-forming methyltransferase MnmC
VARRVLTDDGSWTLASERYGETYRSRRGAALESEHVFLAGSGIAARLTLPLATRVLEIGLGTGLNLALTADLALRTGASLTYIAVEHDPLPADAVASLRLESHADSGFVEALLAWRSAWHPSLGADPPPLLHGAVRLEVIHADAATAPLPAGVDAVYLDGFSPRVNPELWTPGALARFAAALAPGGVLATYSVSGSVRRGLAACGLLVERRPGPPGGKRESLVAHRPIAVREPPSAVREPPSAAPPDAA